MAQRSNKTIWLIAAVLLLIAAQVAVLGFVIARSVSRVVVAQSPQGQRKDRQTFLPPLARPVEPRSSRKMMASKKSAPKPKPTGPRAQPPQFSKEGGSY